MILVDANILLYAEDSLSSRHEVVRKWWDAALSGPLPVCLSWPVITAFLRIGTNPRVFERPLSMEEAVQRVSSWLTQPCVRMVSPTRRHWEVFQQMLAEGQAKGNLISDAHLAALATEHGCRLCSTDHDFARFPSLQWFNPLK